MGLFDIFRNKEKPAVKQQQILLAMPLFMNDGRYRINEVTANLKSIWSIDVDKLKGDDDVATFEIDGETVALAYIPVPVPSEDIAGTAKYAYNWVRASDDLQDHTGHAIVSLMASKKKGSLERFRLMSKVIVSILMTSEAVGVYDGEQSLLIPRDQYLANVEALQQNQVPTGIWVYIGLVKRESGNCAYTYGLKAFQKSEIEIIESALSLEDLYEFLSNISAYVISSDVTLKHGETLGYSADQKISINLSDGQFVDGKSVKLTM